MEENIKTPHLFKGGHMDEQMAMVDPKIGEIWTLDNSKCPAEIVKYKNIGYGILAYYEPIDLVASSHTSEPT